MGQAEILDFLEKNPERWFSAMDISAGTGIGVSSTTVSLKKLRIRGHVEFLKPETPLLPLLYKHKCNDGVER